MQWVWQWSVLPKYLRSPEVRSFTHSMLRRLWVWVSKLHDDTEMSRVQHNALVSCRSPDRNISGDYIYLGSFWQMKDLIRMFFHCLRFSACKYFEGNFRITMTAPPSQREGSKYRYLRRTYLYYNYRQNNWPKLSSSFINNLVLKCPVE